MTDLVVLICTALYVKLLVAIFIWLDFSKRNFCGFVRELTTG